MYKLEKSKVVPVTDRDGLKGCETSRNPHFLDNHQPDGGEVVSLRRQPLSTVPGRFLILIYIRG
jgi:hypothetical protein